MLLIENKWSGRHEANQVCPFQSSMKKSRARLSKRCRAGAPIALYGLFQVPCARLRVSGGYVLLIVAF